jgi:hypothetical protein
MERDTGKKQPDKFLDKLIEGKFSEIFQKEELSRFYRFMNNRGRVAGGFVISLSLEEEGRVWLHYNINPDQSTSKTIRIDTMSAYVPVKPEDRDVPKRLEGLPIWWLQEE